MFPVVDLPEPERQAMRLDGELYRLADGYVSIAVPDVPASRAAATLARRPRRLIAARGTAAWIWGAAPVAPARGEYIVDLSARWRPAPAEGLDVVESVIRPGDVVALGGVLATTPMRTVIDLARFRAVFTPADAAAVRALALLDGFSAQDAITAMDRGRNLAGKQLAAARLEEALGSAGVDPVHVVDRVDSTHRVEQAVEVHGVAHLEDETAESQSVARGRHRGRQDVHVVL